MGGTNPRNFNFTISTNYLTEMFSLTLKKFWNIQQNGKKNQHFKFYNLLFMSKPTYLNLFCNLYLKTMLKKTLWKCFVLIEINIEVKKKKEELD